jgi:restriction system protein
MTLEHFMQIPTFDKLMIPTLKALEQLGGSGGIEEIADGVIQVLKLPDAITSRLHNPEKSSRTEVEYRLAWARTYLKKYGLIDNSERGIWSLTAKYQPHQNLDPAEVVQAVASARPKKKQRGQTPGEEVPPAIAEEVEVGWKEACTSNCCVSSQTPLSALLCVFCAKAGLCRWKLPVVPATAALTARASSNCKTS